jgi:2-polyprenyl-6-methoxyphenol hydroxylase-like FAD-dependent oxidoreductase
MRFERTCLLGDAAFVARPHTAAGTEKAARDAVALSTAIRDRDGLDAALDAWERSQLRYGRELVERGKRMGGDRLGGD